MKCFILNLLVWIFPFYANGAEIDSLLKILDESISDRFYYLKQKENELEELRSLLDKETSVENKFHISKQLMTDYGYFVSDSALFYSQKCVELSAELNNSDYRVESLLNRAYYLCFPGLFHESFRILESIDTGKIPEKYLPQYYNTYIYAYYNQIQDINDPLFRSVYKQKLSECVDAYLSLGRQDSIQYLTIRAYKYYLDGMLKESARTVDSVLGNPAISPYMYAESLYNLGRMWYGAGNRYRGEAKKNLIKASIEYKKLGITKNPPELFLARILWEENDLDRASHYINIAMENAEKFSDSHQYSIAERTHSLIQDTYYAKISTQQKRLQYYFFLSIALFISLAGGLVFLHYRNQMLKKVRARLSETILSLQDANYIKEAYIGHYLSQYSMYISKLEDYRKYVLRKLKLNQTEDIIHSENSAIYNSKRDIDELFSNFDRIFLELYPHFLDDVNNLLREEERFSQKPPQNENASRLRTDMRILALLKLGVNDNKIIASFLRVTVQTVYNYRSKIKCKAINEHTFEEDVKKISNWA